MPVIGGIFSPTLRKRYCTSGGNLGSLRAVACLIDQYLTILSAAYALKHKHLSVCASDSC